ncbi:MAG: hypothetical protein A2X19_05475 [Bacteroidetes bacterium GWE2_39_28]|nr:MAG: hypothetical protein A2X19_05475 [Bacteroidetes bacterium GWE2_39_28]OFY15200.1 MAG: hypothetical protein A2X16_08625 [Bacteroidetes bacterium GWF2_39_10]OFZ09779.1 MAG: hypothetical protein A2465_07625 [Bacteroidetes bacterium RIFOXYC2_FULL_39_11]HCT93826.1 hypothetical protein [Rikenellaceae bacterium]
MFKRIILTLLLALSGSSFLFSQVRISADFDNGSIGKYILLDSVWIKRGANDSILTLTYEIHSRFDPLNPVDTSLRPSARWYHFRMEGVKDKQIFLNIKNSEVIRPFYSYDGINYSRVEEAENQFRGTINKIFTSDTVYISHFLPYTYTRNMQKMDYWKSLDNVEYEVIGESTQGRRIEMLTVTDNSYDNIGKRLIWIHGRSHPSESPSSWHLEAMIDEITSDSPFAKELRKNAVFYIIPYINPDGVYGGYSRSTSTGVNIEVNWDSPDSLTMPEVKALKATMERVTKERPLDMLLNMHSQIASSVTYWIHTAESTTDRFLKEQLMLSSLTINYTPYYRPKDQSFSAVAPRYVEGWIWDRFKESTVAITFETPYTYYNEDRSGTWVSSENLQELGYSVLYAVSDLLDLDGKNRVFVNMSNLKRTRGWVKTDAGYKRLFFGDSYLISQRENSRLRVVIPYLEKGDYELYEWVVGPSAKVFPDDVNRWIKSAEITQKRDGRYVWRIRARREGDEQSAILLVKKR